MNDLNTEIAFDLLLIVRLSKQTAVGLSANKLHITDMPQTCNHLLCFHLIFKVLLPICEIIPQFYTTVFLLL